MEDCDDISLENQYLCPEKIVVGNWKTTFLLKWPLFRGHVKVPGGGRFCFMESGYHGT